jgi:hypothetical protein
LRRQKNPKLTNGRFNRAVDPANSVERPVAAQAVGPVEFLRLRWNGPLTERLFDWITGENP